MKSRKILSNILIIAGVVLGLASACLALTAKDSSPAIVLHPLGARKCAEKMMIALSGGDYKTASSLMYGSPDLGKVPEDGNLAVELIWSEFLGSMEFTASGECYVTDSGVAMDVSVQTLDVPAVIASMEGYARELLGSRIASAGDLSDIYDSDNNIRQEIKEQILRDATVQSLTNNLAYQEHQLTLNLVFENGNWWVVPDAALQKVLSGSF